MKCDDESLTVRDTSPLENREPGNSINPDLLNWKDISECVTDIKVINFDKGEEIPVGYTIAAAVNDKKPGGKQSGVVIAIRRGPRENLYTEMYHETPVVL